MKKLSFVVVGLLAAGLIVGCGGGGGGKGLGSVFAPKVYNAGGDNYSIFHDLMKTSGLDKTLDQGGPYTVFAPTNAAFNALPAGTVQDLQKPGSRDQLVQILTSHVVRGQMNATDVASGQALTAMNGKTLAVGRDQGILTIDGARIVQPNINASNGIVHGIDKVLVSGAPAQPNQPKY
jgi:uncharacterized surface protein with fasciclin (FAS1) repeats